MLTCGPWNSQVWELAGWLRCEWSLKTFLHSWHWESSIRWKSSCVLESCSMSKGIPMLISLNCFSNMHHLVFPKRLPPPGKDLLLPFLVYPKFSVHIKAWALVAGCRVSRVYNSVPIKVRWEAEVLLHMLHVHGFSPVSFVSWWLSLEHHWGLYHRDDLHMVSLQSEFTHVIWRMNCYWSHFQTDHKGFLSCMSSLE